MLNRQRVSKRGRPSLVDEQHVERLLSRSRHYIESMLFDECHKNSLPEEVRFEASLRLVLKSIPQAVQADITEKKYIEVVSKLEGLDTETLRSLAKISLSGALPPPPDRVSEIGEVMDKD